MSQNSHTSKQTSQFKWLLSHSYHSYAFIHYVYITLTINLNAREKKISVGKRVICSIRYSNRAFQRKYDKSTLGSFSTPPFYPTFPRLSDDTRKLCRALGGNFFLSLSLSCRNWNFLANDDRAPPVSSV